MGRVGLHGSRVRRDERSGRRSPPGLPGELSRWLKETPADALEYRRQEAELLFRRIGITFAVYGEAELTERLIPFDVIPRILSAQGMGVCILNGASNSGSAR